MEVIVCLVIIGILGAVMSTGLARIIDGYLFSRDNADMALKGQVVLARMVKEFRSIDGVTAGTKTSLTYSYVKDGNSISNRILSWAGSTSSPLILGGNTLTEMVNDFELTYYHNDYNDPGDNTWDGTEKMIGITLKLTGASGQISLFSTRVKPRNLKD